MSHTVTIEPIGEQIEVEEGQTILAAALRQGVWLPFACGHGTCATCKVQVLEGDVEIGDASPFALMDVERGEGKVRSPCGWQERCCSTCKPTLALTHTHHDCTTTPAHSSGVPQVIGHGEA